MERYRHISVCLRASRAALASSSIWMSSGRARNAGFLSTLYVLRICGDFTSFILSFGSPTFAPANARSDVVDPRAQEANAATTIDMTMRDIGAIVGFLDRAGAGVRVGKLGTIGYCMGGRHALAAAVAAPQAVAAAVSIHGGRMVTDGANSPHLLRRKSRQMPISRSRATMKRVRTPTRKSWNARRRPPVRISGASGWMLIIMAGRFRNAGASTARRAISCGSVRSRYFAVPSGAGMKP